MFYIEPSRVHSPFCLAFSTCKHRYLILLACALTPHPPPCAGPDGLSQSALRFHPPGHGDWFREWEPLDQADTWIRLLRVYVNKFSWFPRRTSARSCIFLGDVNKEQIVFTSYGQPVYDYRRQERRGKNVFFGGQCWSMGLIFTYFRTFSLCKTLAPHPCPAFLKANCTQIFHYLQLKAIWHKVLVFFPNSLYFDSGIKGEKAYSISSLLCYSKLNRWIRKVDCSFTRQCTLNTIIAAFKRKNWQQCIIIICESKISNYTILYTHIF